MRLFLMRHGDAVDEHVNPDRPLSELGIVEVKKVAQFLKNAKMEFNAIYHSAKTRAKQSAELIKKILHTSFALQMKEYLSPNSPREDILKDIARDVQERNVLIVGHLPFLSYLVSQLVTGDEHKSLLTMSTGTLVILEKNLEAWSFVAMITPEFL